MTMLDGKLMEIESTLAFSEEILLWNNLPEILNVKAVLEEKLREVSVRLQTLEAMEKLGYSEVKYMQNDVFLKDATGKLVTSDTEPLLSVAEGKNLTEGLVGTDGHFYSYYKECTRPNKLLCDRWSHCKDQFIVGARDTADCCNRFKGRPLFSFLQTKNSWKVHCVSRSTRKPDQGQSIYFRSEKSTRHLEGSR